MMIYALHPDGTESLIDNDKQFERHIENGGLFGIEKEDWMKYLENGEYLRAAEISTEQNYNMIDGRRNNIETPKVAKPDNEKTSLLERLKEKQQLLISGVSRGTSLETLKKRQDVKITTSREITLDEKSTNTVENAIEAAAWVKKNNIRSIRLVTSNYHMPRSMAEFRANNREVTILAHPVYSERVRKNWWRSWRSFVLIASEYNKFLYVWIKNRIGRLKED